MWALLGWCCSAPYLPLPFLLGALSLTAKLTARALQRHLCWQRFLFASSCSELEAGSLADKRGRRFLYLGTPALFYFHVMLLRLKEAVLWLFLVTRDFSLKVVCFQLYFHTLQMVIWAFKRMVPVFSHIYAEHMHQASYCTTQQMYISVLIFTLFR